MYSNKSTLTNNYINYRIFVCFSEKKNMFIRVANSEDDDVFFEIPFNEQKYVSLATLNFQFPGIIALKYRSSQTNELITYVIDYTNQSFYLIYFLELHFFKQNFNNLTTNLYQRHIFQSIQKVISFIYHSMYDSLKTKLYRIYRY